jgi:hypothetical protein
LTLANLNRQFEAQPPVSEGPSAGFILPPSSTFSLRCRLIDERNDDTAARSRCADHGDLATRQTESFTGSLRTRQPIQRLMTDHGIICSRSRTGKFWNDAAREQSFLCSSYQF